jgi:hypothetical protein
LQGADKLVAESDGILLEGAEFFHLQFFFGESPDLGVVGLVVLNEVPEASMDTAT